MAKLEITDQCLSPEPVLTMNYSGPDPWGVAKKIAGTIKPYFHVSSSGTNQTLINWDISGDPIKFYSIWWVKKSLSRFSFMKVNIRVQGTKSRTTNKGQFRLELDGILQTDFTGINPFLKTVWFIYSYLFYDRARQGFIEICRNFILGFRNEIKDHFNLKTTTIPHARGAVG